MYYIHVYGQPNEFLGRQTKTFYLCFQAPEVYLKQSGSREEYTRTVDIWSLGVMLHECITGIRPFYHGDELT